MSEEDNSTKQYVFPSVKAFKDLSPLLTEIICKLQKENKMLKEKIEALEKSTKEGELKSRILNLEKLVTPALNPTDGWVRAESSDLHLQLDVKINELAASFSKQNPAKTFAEVTKLNTPPSFTDIVSIIKRQDQLKESTPKKSEDCYGSAVIVLDPTANEDLTRLVAPSVLPLE